MKKERYSMRDSVAGFRNTANDIFNYIRRGLDSCSRVTEDAQTAEDVRNYHKGKAEAFREVLGFFDRYKVVETFVQTSKGMFKLTVDGEYASQEDGGHAFIRLPRKGMSEDEIKKYIEAHNEEEA